MTGIVAAGPQVLNDYNECRGHDGECHVAAGPQVLNDYNV